MWSLDLFQEPDFLTQEHFREIQHDREREKPRPQIKNHGHGAAAGIEDIGRGGLKASAGKLGDLRGLSREEIGERTFRNFYNFFKLSEIAENKVPGR